MERRENGYVGVLLEALLCIPPKLEEARLLLESERISAADIDLAAFRYAESCKWETHDALGETPDPRSGTVPGLHSTFLLEVLSLLLDYGLDPNTIVGGESLMYVLYYTDNGYMGADALALLLERGGKPELEADGETLYDSVDFDIIFGAIEQHDRFRYDMDVHFWLVLLGYGGGKGGEFTDIFPRGAAECDVTENEFSTSDLIAHRNYRWGLSFVPGRGESWSLHVFDERSGWEVLRR